MRAPFAFWVMLLVPAVLSSAVGHGHGDEGEAFGVLARRNVMLQRRERTGDGGQGLGRGHHHEEEEQEQTPAQRQARYRALYDRQLRSMHRQQQEIDSQVHTHGPPTQRTQHFLERLQQHYRDARALTTQPGVDMSAIYDSFMHHVTAFNQLAVAVQLNHQSTTSIPHFLSSSN